MKGVSPPEVKTVDVRLNLKPIFDLLKMSRIDLAFSVKGVNVIGDTLLHDSPSRMPTTSFSA